MTVLLKSFTALHAIKRCFDGLCSLYESGKGSSKNLVSVVMWDLRKETR